MKPRTRALQVSKDTRIDVMKRDRWCIFCGNPYNATVAHFISRGQGGLGIMENLARVCMNCHHKLDHTDARPGMLIQFRDYLESMYPNVTDEDRRFKKWSQF